MWSRIEAKDVTSAEEKKSAQRRTDTEMVIQIVTLAKANNREDLLNLQKSRVDIDLWDQNNRTAAQHLAAEENVNRDALNLLFSLGADKSKAAGAAAEVGNFVLMKDLISKCRPNTVVSFAARGNQPEIVDFLLNDWKAEIDTAVYGAARGGHSALVMNLLSRGASKVQAIISAAHGGHHSLVEHLLETATDLEKHKNDLIGWAVHHTKLDGHLKTENLTLRWLSSFKNPALRTQLAERADQTQLLPQAHGLRSLLQEKKLSFDQGLVWLKPEVQGLLIMASSEAMGCRACCGS